MKVKTSKGFTLIELMIVVAIIGILAAVAIPKFADLVTKSKEAGVKGNIGSVRSALSIYYGDTEGVNPANGLMFAALTNGDKYMPTNPGLGDYTLPKNDANGASYFGHSYGKVVIDANILMAATASDGAAGQGIVYNSVNGTAWVNCTHNDTKGSPWSTY